MKFENPIMNISMFEVENVVTGSTPAPAATDIEQAEAIVAGLDADKTLRIVF